MRPVKLIMSAFGSYSDVEIIDFTVVHGGLFLITGDTGAGKTTVFDAITYALYDRTSGGVRDGNMMRSQYAADSTDTYVEYSFLCRGELYTVRRNPEYMRAGKRKNGDGSVRLVKETAKVSLVLPDGREFQGKKRETDQKIEEILGLDSGQFTQIAMIAQGDFLQLLHAGSRERKKIFTKIFQTQMFWKVQEELKEQGKKIYTELEKKEADIRREIGRVDPVFDLPDVRGEGKIAELTEQWNEIADHDMPDAEQTERTARRIVQKGEELLSGLSERERSLQKEADNLRVLIEKKQETNRLFDLLEKVQERYTRLRKDGEIFEDMRRQSVLGERAERARNLELQALRTQQELARMKHEESELEIWAGKHLADEKRLQTELQELEREFAGREPEIQAEIARMRDMLPRYEEIRRLKSECERQTERMNICINECSRTSSEYEMKYRRFFEGQAGILAEALEEGMPCPVCGAVHHPDKARRAEDVPDQNEVEKAKKARERAEQSREKVQAEYQKTRAALAAEEAALGENPPDLKAVKLHLSRLEKELESSRKGIEKARAEHRKCSEENRRKAGQLESLRRQSAETLKRLEEEKKAFYEEIKSRNFNDNEEYRQAVQWIQEWKKKEQKVKTYDSEMLRCRTQIETLEKQIGDRKRASTEPDEIRQRELGSTLREIRKKSMDLHGRNETNKSAYENLKKYFETQAELRRRYEIISNLSRTANGNLSGSAKLDFETYIQRRYFRKIIQAANRRLARMTSNGFILQCRDIRALSSQGQAGLDLDVYDMVSNSIRDVKSLSGGESFMAALSMALGLADIVQNTAGAVNLETMFVDEGFGSLDDEARERAIRILKELAGEKDLVGIISHVNELKEQIDWKLNVIKTEQGSRTEWIQ